MKHYFSGHSFAFLILLCAACSPTEKSKPDTASPQTAQTTAKPAGNLKELQDRLVEALEKKDLQLLRPLLANTLTDGSEDGGAQCPRGCPVDTFWARKTVDKAQLAHFFETFLRIAKGGFAPAEGQKGRYSAPAFHLKLGNQELFIVGKKVNIREKPGTQAKVILQKSYEKVKYVGDSEGWSQTEAKDGHHWVKIKLPGGKIGYVAIEFTSEGYYERIEAVEKGGDFCVSGVLDSFACAL